MDRVEFGEWYGATHPRLVSSLCVVTGDAAVAAEVVDEAFARAYERWARVGAMDSPAGWTYRTALNAFRRRERRRTLEARLRLHSTIAVAADAGAPPPDWSAEVWDALRRLPERERTAVALRYIADLSTAEIALAMGVAPGTVGSTLHAARRTLAAVLADPVAERARATRLIGTDDDTCPDETEEPSDA